MFQGLLIVCRCGGHLLSPEQAAPGHGHSQHMGTRNVGDESPTPLWAPTRARPAKTSAGSSSAEAMLAHRESASAALNHAMAVRELLALAAVLHRGLVRGTDQRLDLGLESRGPLGVRSSQFLQASELATRPLRAAGTPAGTGAPRVRHPGAGLQRGRVITLPGPAAARYRRLPRRHGRAARGGGPGVALA